MQGVDETDPSGSAEAAERLRLLGAVLFSAGGPVAEDELVARLSDVKVGELPSLMANLNLRLAGVGLVARPTGSGWDVVTAPDLAQHLRDRRDRARPLGTAALETLAVIASEQPCTRADIARLRGVEVGSDTLASLQQSGWIAVHPRKKGSNGASLFVTTAAFLQDFGVERSQDACNL